VSESTTLEKYNTFLRSKVVAAKTRGLAAVTRESLNPKLKPHQKDIALWAIHGGNRAIFANFGLGKTVIQLQILISILDHCDPIAAGLVVCPLGVKGEFVRDAKKFFNRHIQYVRTAAELETYRAAGQRLFITNYERVRDGDLDPNLFEVTTLDEAAVLRSFGSVTYQSFLTLFDQVPYKFVATATPSPNRLKELIHYAAYLGIMDSGLALTRWFKRDPQKAGNLTLHAHKEAEFWLWVSTWATFLDKPSDLGHDDTGYLLPQLKIHLHRLPVDHATAGADSWGQTKMFRSAATSLSDAAREKRDSLEQRLIRARQIIDKHPNRHWLLWHTLENERRAIEKTIPGITTVYGSQDLEEREGIIADFSDGQIRRLATKPSIAGSGCNFQAHCYSAIFLGLDYKFSDLIQACHRIHRFLQKRTVDIYLIYTESEDPIYDELMRKWAEHDRLRDNMTQIMKTYGLNNARATQAMERAIGIERQEQKGELFQMINNDSCVEMLAWPDNSIDLLITSCPFGNHFEYTPSYNDLGHNAGDDEFFEQMDFLSPELHRTLKPGRIYAVHCKDRLLYGSVSGLGMYSVNPFSDKCIAHLQKHGFIFCGRITVVTDVVRENNQTYRLGWTENSKDGTKMGVGSPEYVLLFRKLPTDTTRAYADVPVAKPKEEYTRARWQFDASPFWRSSGNRFLSPEEIRQMPQPQLRTLWREFNSTHVYKFQEHVEIAEALEKEGLLPASFMLLDPTANDNPWVWDDVVRMRTLNAEQSRKRVEQHICPLQIDIVERLIERYSNPGELVFDPFAGIGTVPSVAILQGRRGAGCELSSEYWADAVGYCRAAETKVTTPTLFDALESAENESVAPRHYPPAVPISYLETDVKVHNAYVKAGIRSGPLLPQSANAAALQPTRSTEKSTNKKEPETSPHHGK
jgi:DNA modification methylase